MIMLGLLGDFFIKKQTKKLASVDILTINSGVQNLYLLCLLSACEGLNFQPYYFLVMLLLKKKKKEEGEEENDWARLNLQFQGKLLLV